MYQEDLDGSQDVHGSGKSGAQVEAETHGAAKFWAQGPGDHVVGATSCQES